MNRLTRLLSLLLVGTLFLVANGCQQAAQREAEQQRMVAEEARLEAEKARAMADSAAALAEMIRQRAEALADSLAVALADCPAGQ